jgi:Rrf2 family iron-sulfur cluster assembly transcriptional regulator
VLSNTADYALRAILVLARATRERPGTALRADEIAEATGAPRNYLAKTLNALAKAKLLASARGPGGGFALAVSPATLTVAAVVDLFDEPRRTPRCLLGAAPCNPAAPCVAHQRWSAITTARREPLASTTIADLLGARPAIRGRLSRPA